MIRRRSTNQRSADGIVAATKKVKGPGGNRSLSLHPVFLVGGRYANGSGISDRTG